MQLGIPNSQVMLTDMRQYLQENHSLLGWQLELTSNDSWMLGVWAVKFLTQCSDRDWKKIQLTSQ